MSLEEFSQALFGNLKRFRELDDKSGAEVISSSCITCLAHLAVLCEVICRTDPVARVETHSLCDSALERLGMLTYELKIDEYTYLDLPLEVRPSLCRLSTAAAQTRDLSRTLGRNRCRSSTFA